MNKTVSVLALFTFALLVFASANVFGGFNIGPYTAAVYSGVESIIESAMPAGKSTEESLPILLFTELTEEEKQALFDHASSLVASTALLPEEEEEEELSMNIDDWKIFYADTNFDGSSAYTLRYPPAWVMNDASERVKFLMHEADGEIYSLAFYEDVINIASRGNFAQATSTLLGDTQFTKKSAISNGTTTLVAYVPEHLPRSFSVAFGTVPPYFSSEYVEIYERILSTLAVQPAEHIFKIHSISVGKPSLNLTTHIAIATPNNLSWSISKTNNFKKGDTSSISVWVEDKRGERLTELGAVSTEAASPASFVLPPLCSFDNTTECIKASDLVFGGQYRVVMEGEQTNKAYSAWFTIYDDKQFSNQSLVATPIASSAPAKVSVVASITGRANATDRYIVYFGEGAYSVLPQVAAREFRGEWIRQAPTNANAITHMYLMRTTAEALERSMYGANTLEQIQTYGDVILIREI